MWSPLPVRSLGVGGSGFGGCGHCSGSGVVWGDHGHGDGDEFASQWRTTALQIAAVAAAFSTSAAMAAHAAGRQSDGGSSKRFAALLRAKAAALEPPGGSPPRGSPPGGSPRRRVKVPPRKRAGTTFERLGEDGEPPSPPLATVAQAQEFLDDALGRCDVMCISDELDLGLLVAAWAQAAGRGLVPPAMARLLSEDVCVQELADGRWCFCFSFGSIVCWGFQKAELREVLKLSRQCANEALPANSVKRDYMFYENAPAYSEGGAGTPLEVPAIRGDLMCLMTRSVDEALAYSYAFAQSAKLAVFEDLVESAIKRAAPIPEALAHMGKIDMNKTLVSQQLGELFVTKCSMTLQSDLIDTPDIFWENDRFDDQYCALRSYLEISKRVNVLNQRLEVLNDLYSFLQSQLEVDHAHRLEIVVIVLIVMSILVDLLLDPPGYYNGWASFCSIGFLCCSALRVGAVWMVTSFRRRWRRRVLQKLRRPLLTLAVLAAIPVILLAGAVRLVPRAAVGLHNGHMAPGAVARMPASVVLGHSAAIQRGRPSSSIAMTRTPLAGGSANRGVKRRPPLRQMADNDGQAGSVASASMDRGQLIKQVWGLLSRPDRLWLAAGAAALFASSATELLFPPLIAAALFAAAEQRARVDLISRVVALGFAGGLYGLLNGLRGYAFQVTRIKFVQRLRQRAFMALLAKDMSFHDNVDAGELTPRLSGDCQAVFQSLDDALNFMLRSGVVVIFGAVALIRISPLVTLCVSMVLGGLLVCTERYGHINRIASRQTQDEIAELNRVAGEGLTLLSTVRALDAEDVHRRYYSSQNEKVSGTQLKRSLAFGLFQVANSGLTTMARAVALLIGGLLALSPARLLTGETLATYLLYLDMFVDGALDLGDEWSSAMGALGSGEFVLGLVKDPPAAPSGTQQLPSVSGEMQLNDVTFAYPGRPERKVLNNASIHFRAGEVTALVGVSGSGKSSVLNLLQRIYDVENGVVTLDGVDLRSVDVSWLRRQLGVVGQEPRLFRGTIAENIAWGLPGGAAARMEEVKAAASKAFADEFIERLSHGYDTIVADGKLLSGGQRQRLAIARALIRDPAILILDEATSALDPTATKLVSQSLENARWSPRLGRHRTVIVIAHRLSTVEHADQIVVLDRGSVTECGSHAELMASGGLYQRLVADQRLPTDHTPRL